MNVEPCDLTVDDLTVRFGGLVAVDGLSLHAPPGAITGLIGPNGAGKTTTFNACTGFVKAGGGSLKLGEDSLAHRGPSARAQMGLGRTFQRMELWNNMTVQQNVALGPECFYSGQRPWGQVLGARWQRAQIQERTDHAVELCGVKALAHRAVGDLSTGQRRLVELARAMATPFRFLLLDEPSSGLDGHESERFGEILAQLVADTGLGILLVEHDMALVSAICRYVYVLDFGRLIFEGTMAEAMSSELVRDAYLGTGGPGVLSAGEPGADEEVAANA
jgi:ABC-type branched-subunit amino acid transport system ATPase component